MSLTFTPRETNDYGIEAAKWFALASMTIDHVNKYIFNGTIDLMFDAGRVAFPLFILVFAYNLTRSNANYSKITQRLCTFCAIASLPYLALGGLKWGWHPLNIFSTFIAVLTIIVQIKRKSTTGYVLATFIFTASGFLVEYGWIGISIGVFAWLFFSFRNFFTLLILIAALLSLVWINGNYVAIGAIPIFCLCRYNKFKIPRFKYLFYWYYPLHLSILILIRIPLAKAGYLFIGSPLTWA